MKKILYLTKKQIVIIVFFLIIILIIFCVYLSMNRRQKTNVEANKQDYIVTEYFVEMEDNSSKTYEVRYYTGKKESYLILAEKNGVKMDETLSEIKTEFTNEYVNFKMDDKISSKVYSLSQYADDSGFVYKCTIDEMQAFLTNEGASGKIRFVYATPSYFECYVENKEGNLMRGLLMYNSDAETGTLIYRPCNKDIRIPTVLEVVIGIKSNKE